MINISSYKITWIEVRPTSGRKVTMADFRKMGRVSVHRNGFGYAWFSTKERAMEWLKIERNLSKRYEVRLFTDKQFGMAKKETGYAIPFTQKQFAEVYYI
jgi:predicted glutamine amidotransferase